MRGEPPSDPLMLNLTVVLFAILLLIAGILMVLTMDQRIEQSQECHWKEIEVGSDLLECQACSNGTERCVSMKEVLRDESR